MFTKFSLYFYKVLKIFDHLINFLTKRSFMSRFKEFLIEDSYKIILINKKKVIFFVPNSLIEYRLNTFFTKEPETLDWIKSFDSKKELIFWDIGANIGLYSIFAATIHPNCKVVSFEPSSNNLRTLTRNISINKMHDRIKVFVNPLSDKNDKFQMMQDNEFKEGGALNSFGENYNFEGKFQNYNMKYKLLGKNIKSILKNRILEVPDHIKIDVDGIEHLILEGAGDFLKDKKIKSISVEINENFKIQYKKVSEILLINNFKFFQKKQSDELQNSISKFSKTFNYLFVKI